MSPPADVSTGVAAEARRGARVPVSAWAHAVAGACGMAALLLGVVTGVGWLVRIDPVVQPLPGFAPMQFNTALCFALSGAALLLLGRERQLAAWAALVPVGVIAAVTSIQFLLDVTIGIDQLLVDHHITTDTSHPGRMAPNTALGFLLTVIALGLHDRRVAETWRATLGVTLANVVFALGAVALIGYAGNLEAAYGWASQTRMSITAAVGMVLLGIGIFAMATRGQVRGASVTLRWLTVTAVVVVSALSLVLWLTLSAQQRADLDDWLRLAAAVAADQAAQDLGERHAELARLLPYLIDDDMGVMREQAKRLVDQLPGLLAVARVTPDLGVVWIVPAGAPAELDPVWLAQLEAGPEHAESMLLPSPARADGPLATFALVQPVNRGEASDGWLLAWHDAPAFFGWIFHRVSLPELHLQVTDHQGRLVHASAKASAAMWTPAAPASGIAGTPGWQVSAMPTSRLLADRVDVLPTAVLGIGLMLAVLLGCSLHLLRLVQLRGRMLTAANQELESRVAARTRDLEDARKQVQQALDTEQEGRRRLRVLFDSLAEAIYTVDSDGRCTYCNASCVRMLGYDSPEALIGRNMHELIHHTRADGTPYPVEECRVYQGILNGQGAHVDDEVLWRADGSSFEAEYWSIPVRDAGGRLLSGVVSFLDVTERNSARRALERRSEQQAAVAQLGLAALRGLDLQQLLDRVIDAAASVLDVELCKILELQPDGQHLRLVTGVGWAPGLVGSARVPAGADSQAGYTLSVDQPVIVSDLRRETRFRGPALLSDHGVVSGMSTIIHSGGGAWGVLGVHSRFPRAFDDTDIDFLQGLANVVSYTLHNEKATREIRALNDELEDRVAQRTAALEAANRELEGFSYSVSHDLRAPLRAIDGFAGVLEEDHAHALDPEGRRVLAVIRSNAAKMGRLIDELLQFSRLGRRGLDAAPVDMTALAQEVMDELVAGEPDREFDVCVAPLPAACGDAMLLRQVWVNLIGNAIKYTGGRRPATIRVAGSSRGGESIYTVTDNGVGFDMAYVDKLFGVFQRLHRESEFPGTGVGLALVQRIVTRHGGRVWAEAEEGQGATFSFALPEGGADD